MTTSHHPRRFNRRQRAALYAVQQGACALCLRPLGRRWHADHVVPHSAGGATDVLNGAAVCEACNLKKGARVKTVRPFADDTRLWQQDCLERYFSDPRADFLAVACTGSGKTTLALAVLHRLLVGRQAARAVVVCPTEHLKVQWSKKATRNGIDLDPHFDKAAGQEGGDFHGICVTYQAVVSDPDLFRKQCQLRPTAVVFDEIHHAGVTAGDLGVTWGDAVRAAFTPAARRLLLTGTPFRSDASRIPFVAYDAGGVCVPDHQYDYGQALRDGVVRPVIFPHYEGQMRWLSDGDEVTARFADDLTDTEASRRMRTALDPAGEWVTRVVRDADAKLCEVRAAGHPAAGGLVVAIDTDHARKVAEVVRRVTGVEPPVIVHEMDRASEAIEAFTNSTRPWAVAVRMISEGVDIPRLRVGVYLTNVKTPLFFTQFAGRLLRVVDDVPEQTAYLYMPADPALMGAAAEIHRTVLHHLAESADPADDPAATAARAERRVSTFTPLGADAEPNGIIHNGDAIAPSEVARARQVIPELVGVVNDALLATVVRRLDREYGRSQPAAPPAARPAEPLPAYARRKAVMQARTKAVNQIVAQMAAACPSLDVKHAYKCVYGTLNDAVGVRRAADAGIADNERMCDIVSGWSDTLATLSRQKGDTSWWVREFLSRSPRTAG